MRTVGLFSAVLIMINVVVGSGIFINVLPLGARLGTASFCAYLVAALFLLPVVASLALLARHQPESGGLYVYTTTYVHRFLGFLSSWMYFVGKAVSVGLMAHVLIMALERACPAALHVPHIVLVAALLSFFAAAHCAGIRLQGRVQWVAIAAKVIPVLVVVALLAWHGPVAPFSAALLNAENLSAAVPIAVFAMVGFEVISSVAHVFVRPEYTIVRAALIGFTAVATLLAVFQASVSLLAPTLASVGQGPAATLMALADTYLASHAWSSVALAACVYASIVGGSFSILTSNCWNLHRLAVQGHMPGRQWLAATTAQQVPWASVWVEVCISVLAVAISDQQVPLQNMSVCGVIFAFFCAMLAAWRARSAHGARVVHPVVAGTAVLSTVVLLGFTVFRVYTYGVSIPYLLLCGGGIVISLVYEKVRGQSY